MPTAISEFGSGRASARGAAAVPWLHALTTLALAVSLVATHRPALAQTAPPPFTIEAVLSSAFPSLLVSARTTDRIAWVENERGVRNVYTAVAPDFVPVRLTSTTEDDGVDLRPLQISDDGSVVVFIRGHAPGVGGESEIPGWIANPAIDPEGGRNGVWAVYTSGDRRPWRVVTARNVQLSPDGRWVAYVRDGQIHRAPVDPGVDPNTSDDAKPLFRDYGVNEGPVWSPDSRKIAFVSTRDDHSFIGVYDTGQRQMRYLAPSVDFDSAPIWSPDGSRIAFLRRPGLPFGAWADVPSDASLPPGFVEARFRGGHTLAIWVADMESGEGHELWHNPSGDSLFAEILRIDWAGDHILFRAEPDNWRHYFSVSVSSPRAQATLLTPGEGEVEREVRSSERRSLGMVAGFTTRRTTAIWIGEICGGCPWVEARPSA